MAKGRPKDRESMEKVREMLNIGLDKAAIARALKKDPAQVQRWVAYLEEESRIKNNDIIDNNE